MRRPNENDLPADIEETVVSIAQLHTEHYRNVTPVEKRISAIAGLLVRPSSIIAFTVLVGGWVALNLLGAGFGYPPLDPVPFAGLAMAASVASFYLMVLVLATQRQEDRLAELREQLTLQVALLSERKTAKVIELLEELRRDLPLVHNRADPQAEAMAQPADTGQVVGAIKETQDAVEELRRSFET
jgi:uncharacterized membrane protein